VSDDKNKPVLDEHTLGKLLEAAYVLQEHNREIRARELATEFERDPVMADQKSRKPGAAETAAPADYTLMLAEIVETQQQIQVRQLALDDAMTLVVERVIGIGRAGGAAIGMVEGTNLHYRARAGLMTPPGGAIVRIEKSLSNPCLNNSQVFRCPDVDAEFLPDTFDTEECRRRRIASMIAVPVFHDGGVVGGLELYYSKPNAFTEQDVQTCQLMAGLITEALARDEEITWKKSLATERAAMLEALEKLKPNLAALLDQPRGTVSATARAEEFGESCRKCGHTILGEEQFCGQCGSPRSGDYEPANLQSKVASLWQMLEARGQGSPGLPPREDGAEPLPEDLGKPFSPASLGRFIDAPTAEAFDSDVPTTQPQACADSPAELLNTELETSPREGAEVEVRDQPAQAGADGTSNEVALAKIPPSANWSSAASARAFLEQVAGANPASSLIRFWNNRRGDIYLGVALILVACVVGWGVWSGHSVGATAAPNSGAAAHHKSPEADLSMFDRMLIHLGLADPPDAPEDMGNPAVTVWIDSRTGLYYCPGADLYGKTPKGKLASQREAQLDQFQPAYRKACN
jgi:GAF domain-containing protein